MKIWEVKLEVGAAILTQEVKADYFNIKPHGVCFYCETDSADELAFYPMGRIVSVGEAEAVKS